MPRNWTVPWQAIERQTMYKTVRKNCTEFGWFLAKQSRKTLVNITNKAAEDNS